MEPLAPFGMMPPQVAGPVMFPGANSTPQVGFQDALWQAFQEASAISNNAQGSVEQSLVSEDLSMVESFTAVREADLALRFLIQIRNKLMDAYQEIQQLRM